jgi:hypothetical protein
MYKEYLGEGYHEKIRKMLTADETLLPDRIIDADLNIGAMKMLITPAMEKMAIHGKTVNTEEKYNTLATAALHYLAGVLCLALKSRTAVPPYNKFKRNWDKKRGKFMDRGNRLMLELIRWQPKAG